MTYFKLIWEVIITGEYNPYNTILNSIIAGGFTGLSVMKYLRDANNYINEFGYSITVLCIVGALILKAIYMRYQIKKAKNGS